jgi:hypothetical protein
MSPSSTVINIHRFIDYIILSLLERGGGLYISFSNICIKCKLVLDYRHHSTGDVRLSKCIIIQELDLAAAPVMTPI